MTNFWIKLQVLMRRRNIAFYGYDGMRCLICGCVPVVQWAHPVAKEITQRLGYQFLVTCSSYYCRAQDEVRR